MADQRSSAGKAVSSERHHEIPNDKLRDDVSDSSEKVERPILSRERPVEAAHLYCRSTPAHPRGCSTEGRMRPGFGLRCRSFTHRPTGQLA